MADGLTQIAKGVDSIGDGIHSIGKTYKSTQDRIYEKLESAFGKDGIPDLLKNILKTVSDSFQDTPDRTNKDIDLLETQNVKDNPSPADLKKGTYTMTGFLYMGNTLQHCFDNLSSVLNHGFNKIKPKNKKKSGDAVKIKQKVEKPKKSPFEGVQKIFKNITDTIKKPFTIIGDKFSKMTDGLKNVFSKVSGFFGNIGKTIGSLFKGRKGLGSVTTAIIIGGNIVDAKKYISDLDSFSNGIKKIKMSERAAKNISKTLTRLATTLQNIADIKIKKSAIKNLEIMETAAKSISAISKTLAASTVFFLIGTLASKIAEKFIDSYSIVINKISSINKKTVDSAVEKSTALTVLAKNILFIAAIFTVSLPLFLTGSIGALLGYVFIGSLILTIKALNATGKSLNDAQNIAANLVVFCSLLFISAFLVTMSAPFFVAGTIAAIFADFFLGALDGVFFACIFINMRLEAAITTMRGIAIFAVLLFIACVLLSLTIVPLVGAMIGLVVMVVFLTLFSFIGLLAGTLAKGAIKKLLIVMIMMAVCAVCIFATVALLSLVGKFTIENLPSIVGGFLAMIVFIAAFAVLGYVVTAAISVIMPGIAAITVIMISLVIVALCTMASVAIFSKLDENLVLEASVKILYLVPLMLAASLAGFAAIPAAIGIAPLTATILLLVVVGLATWGVITVFDKIDEGLVINTAGKMLAVGILMAATIPAALLALVAAPGAVALAVAMSALALAGLMTNIAIEEFDKFSWKDILFNVIPGVLLLTPLMVAVIVAGALAIPAAVLAIPLSIAIVELSVVAKSMNIAIEAFSKIDSNAMKNIMLSMLFIVVTFAAVIVAGAIAIYAIPMMIPLAVASIELSVVGLALGVTLDAFSKVSGAAVIAMAVPIIALAAVFLAVIVSGAFAIPAIVFSLTLALASEELSLVAQCIADGISAFSSVNSDAILEAAGSLAAMSAVYLAMIPLGVTAAISLFFMDSIVETTPYFQEISKAAEAINKLNDTKVDNSTIKNIKSIGKAIKALKKVSFKKKDLKKIKETFSNLSKISIDIGWIDDFKSGTSGFESSVKSFKNGIEDFVSINASDVDYVNGTIAKSFNKMTKSVKKIDSLTKAIHGLNKELTELAKKGDSVKVAKDLVDSGLGNGGGFGFGSLFGGGKITKDYKARGAADAGVSQGGTRSHGAEILEELKEFHKDYTSSKNESWKG